MARDTRQRISYVIPLAASPGGHRLGVNGLAVDPDRSILYSGGRDGLICAWDLGLDLQNKHGDDESSESPGGLNGQRAARGQNSTVFRNQVQAHTHWVNDIALAYSNSALVSASSDITVKLWRPHSEERSLPTTIGLHHDYVKCLASPSAHADWIASGGLDHKIRLWDLHGNGETLQIDAGESENSPKSSVYALSVQGSVLASGGPESIVRLWDSRTGKRITNFVGHTDNIRDILLNQTGDTVMTASSDQSIKVWSITAGRCMYTLTMHNDSVWSLHSDDPKLAVFYSGDRSGLVAKTDVRHCDDMDEGLSMAVAKEQSGVSKLTSAGGFIWTATSNSSINRWQDVDTTQTFSSPEPARPQAITNIISRTKAASFTSSLPPSPHSTSFKTRLPLTCLLRISINAPIPGQSPIDAEASTIYSGASARKISEALIDQESQPCVPYHNLPEETIEGQNGLIKHVLLNDRRRVLTLDTTGEVMLWDLLKCSPIKSFGKRYLDDVRSEVDNHESIANWCGVETQTGRLVVVLEKNYCFDAEVYADELEFDNAQEFRDDQRINLGKWVLRYLFARLVVTEEERDAAYRSQLKKRLNESGNSNRTHGFASNQLPKANVKASTDDGQDDSVTPRNAPVASPPTPGSAITPFTSNVNGPTLNNQQIPATINEDSQSEPNKSRKSTEKATDYFPDTNAEKSSSDGQQNSTALQSEGSQETSNATGSTEQRDEKAGSSLFGKKFRMNFPKKLGRSSVEAKQMMVDERSEESEKSDLKEEKSNELLFMGTIDGIRSDYEDQAHRYPSHEIIPEIRPSPPSDTPILQHPPYTTIIISETQPDAGGIVDQYRGTVSSVGRDADLIEKCAPRWLGDLLLRNQLPDKELGKVSFVLLPYKDLLPSIASADGNTRLTANRMLRAKKVLSYVAERIETPQPDAGPETLKPEEYLELYCQNQLVEHNATLATLRSHVWRTGGDVLLYYKSNGKKREIEDMISKRTMAMNAAEVSGKVGPSVPSDR